MELIDAMQTIRDAARDGRIDAYDFGVELVTFATPKVKIKLVGETSKMPVRSTDGSAGLDLFADIPHAIEIPPGAMARISLGVVFAIPHGFVGLLDGRSGHAVNWIWGFSGRIDSDYRGPVSALLINHGGDLERIEPGQKIAQLIIVPCLMCGVEVVDSLPETVRGAGGWGSTGR